MINKYFLLIKNSMKQINIHSNPEYDTPNKKICKSIIRYILNIEKIKIMKLVSFLLQIFLLVI